MALGDFEQLVLLAAMHLGKDAYGVRIVDAIEERTDRTVSRSALYVTFDRLEAKGFLKSQLRAGGETRGGKLRRCIAVTKPGLAALRESREALLGMWRGLEPVLKEGRE